MAVELNKRGEIQDFSYNSLKRQSALNEHCNAYSKGYQVHQMYSSPWKYNWWNQMKFKRKGEMKIAVIYGFRVHSDKNFCRQILLLKKHMQESL